MQKLSFCIITAGKRNEQLELVLTSIIAQRIPDFEIIVSGAYRPDPRVVFVPAVEAARKGKLSILRNLGVAKATGDLIVILDDDVILSPTWYQDFTFYCQPFDILTSQVRLPDGTRYWDHVTSGGPRGHVMLADDEADDYCYMSGGSGWVMNRQVAETVAWEENLGFYEGEDADFSSRCRLAGFRINHNPAMLVYHADSTYTSAGRKVMRRRGYYKPASIVNEAIGKSIWDLVFFAKSMIDDGDDAKAVDIIRIGSQIFPESTELQGALQWFIESYCGGSLDGNSDWYLEEDPEYLDTIRQCQCQLLGGNNTVFMFDKPLEPYIVKQVGRYIYLSDFVLPQTASKDEMRRSYAILDCLNPFYFHFGGAGDALMLMATFDANKPGTSILCCPNSTKQMESFFEAFPFVETVYFLPHPMSVPSIPEEARGHIHELFRYLAGKHSKCLGRGTTPLEDYNIEWHSQLDIEQVYGVVKHPAWAHLFKKDRQAPYQVVLAPKGSNNFGFRSKRNVTDPRFWSPLLSFLNQQGINPIVIGTPDEEAAYPLDHHCIDKRSYSFREQMEIVASSDLLIAADSWHKTFAALTGVPAIVFQAMTGMDIRSGWKDNSEYVFIDPWEEISFVRSMGEFFKAFKEVRENGRIVSRRVNPPADTDRLPALTSFARSFWLNNYSTSRTVLIRSSSAIGDALNLTAVTAELKRQYPHLDIYVSGTSIVENIFRHNRHITGFVPLLSNEELYLEGQADITLEYNFILDRFVEYLNCIGFMDIYGNIAGIKLNNFDIYYTIEMDEALWAVREVKKIASSGLKIGLQFTTGKDIKRSYPHGRRVIQELTNRYPESNFILFGNEQLDTPQINVYDCARREVPFRNQIALAAQCDAFITIDSAFFHVGHNLCKKPTLLIAGPTNPILIGSADSGFMPVRNTKLDCLDCYWSKTCKIECMENLLPERIADSFDLLISSPQVACHAWRRSLDETEVVLPNNTAYEDIIIQLLSKVRKPLRFIFHDPFSVLPTAAANWNGADLVPETIECSLPSNYERIACPFCNSVQAEKCRVTGDIVMCSDCRTVYLRTRLKKEAMELLYQSYADGDSHMKIPQVDEQVHTSGLRRDYFLREILEFVKPHGTLLDVGCGWGAFLNNARSKGFTSRGIELTRKGAAFANNYLGIDVTSNQFLDTPFEPNSIAVVTMLHVLEHLPEPCHALRKVFDILEPGGMYCGIVPNFASFCSRVEGEKWLWLDPDYHYIHFTPETLTRHLEAAGFVLERLYTVRGDYGTIPIRTVAANVGSSFSDDAEFNEWLTGIEAEGQGEEIRFFARKQMK